MNVQRDIAVIVGSLRKESWTKKVALAMIGLAPEGLSMEIVEIRELPLYDADLEQSVPAAWATFRERIDRAEAFLFVTPEYNRTIPGALKNAMDVGSRPRGQSVWHSKPGAVVSVTPGALGAMAAHHQVRQAMVGIGVPAMASPEAYIGGVAALFDEEGNLSNVGTRDFLVKFLTAFKDWVEANAKKV